MCCTVTNDQHSTLDEDKVSQCRCWPSDWYMKVHWWAPIGCWSDHQARAAWLHSRDTPSPLLSRLLKPAAKSCLAVLRSPDGSLTSEPGDTPLPTRARASGFGSGSRASGASFRSDCACTLPPLRVAGLLVDSACLEGTFPQLSHITVRGCSSCSKTA
jgi:hypothetical protein